LKTKTKENQTMGTLIPQTKYDVLAPGTYRVKLGAVAVEDGIYGTQVVMRFDVLNDGFSGRSVKAWAAAKLSGGRRPSKRYCWTSALLFGGGPLPRRPPFVFGSGFSGAPPGGAFQRGKRRGGLPEGYDLDTDALRNREAWALVEVIDRDGVLYNRIVQLFPLRGMGRGDIMLAHLQHTATGGHGDEAAKSPERAVWESFSPNPPIPAESQGIFDEEPLW
jgi:hypothetical protein